MLCNKNMRPLFKKENPPHCGENLHTPILNAGYKISSLPPPLKRKLRKPPTKSRLKRLIIITIENNNIILANIVIYKYKTCIFRSNSNGFSIQTLIVSLYH